MNTKLNGFEGMSPTQVGIATINRETTYVRILVLFTILFGILVFYGSSMGVRGTDQYWYVADIQTVLDGQPYVSNNLYPPSILGNENPGRQPFIHNLPYIYLAAIPGYFFGAYAGAIVINSLSFIISAIFIFLTLRRFRINDRIAASSAGIFMLFPMNYWLTINAMSEAGLVPAITFLGWLLIKKGHINNTRWILSLTCIGYMIFARESLVILGLLFPLFYLIYKQELTAKTLLVASSILATVIAIYWFRAVLLPHNVNCSFSEMVRRMTPGVSDNMFCYFNTESIDLNFSLWWSKIVANLNNQFNINGSGSYSRSIALSFYLPTNFLIAISLYFAFWKSSDVLTRRLGFLLIGLVIVHLATLIVIENLPRYLIILPPIAFILTTASVRETLLQRRNAIKGSFILVVVALFSITNLIAANTVRANSITESTQIAQIKDITKTFTAFSENSGFVETDSGDNMCLLGYALQPGTVLFSRSHYPQDIKDELVQKINPGYAILKPDSIFSEKTGISLEKVADMPDPFTKHTLYRVIK